MLTVPKFASYKARLLILSLQIVFMAICIEWLYSIYEDYVCTTIRNFFSDYIAYSAVCICADSKGRTGAMTGRLAGFSTDAHDPGSCCQTDVESL